VENIPGLCYSNNRKSGEGSVIRCLCCVLIALGRLLFNTQLSHRFKSASMKDLTVDGSGAKCDFSLVQWLNVTLVSFNG